MVTKANLRYVWLELLLNILEKIDKRPEERNKKQLWDGERGKSAMKMSQILGGSW